MHLSKEVLNSIQNNLVFHSVDEIFIVSDCEQVVNKKSNLSSMDCVYWLDYSPLTEQDLKKSKGILLVNKKNIRLFQKKQLDANKVISSDDPKLLFLAIDEYLRNQTVFPEIHPSAQINPAAQIGENVFIGPGAILEACYIGNNSVIHAHCSIGKNVKIGSNAVIYSGTRIGFNVFGFKKNHAGEWTRLHQIAGVTIGNNVTIGSNTCINSGFITDTIIKDHAYIDSLCQIGESVIVGNNTVVAASCFIATNTRIGDRCWISPNVSIIENIEIVDDVFVGIGSVVLRNIKKPCRVFGVPAKSIDI